MRWWVLTLALAACGSFGSEAVDTPKNASDAGTSAMDAQTASMDGGSGDAAGDPPVAEQDDILGGEGTFESGTTCGSLEWNAFQATMNPVEVPYRGARSCQVCTDTSLPLPLEYPDQFTLNAPSS